MRLSRAVDDLGHEVARYEQHSAARAEYYVARKHDSVAEPGRRVEAGHEKIAYRRRVDAAVVDLNALYLLHLLDVADAAPDYRAASLGAGRDRGRQVAAEECALVYLVIHIDDKHVALDQ